MSPDYNRRSELSPDSGSSGPSAAPQVEDERTFLEELLFTTWRRKWIIITTVVLGLAGTYLYASQVTPLYSSTALLTLDARRNEVIDLGSVLSGLPLNREAMETEAVVLRSPELALRVIRKLDLAADPEFARWLRPPRKERFVNAPFRMWRSLLENIKPVRSTKKVPASIEEERENYLIGMMLSRTEVLPSEFSLTIAVTFRSAEPKKAALIANTIIDEYLSTQVEEKFQATARASAWLTEQVENLREKVRRSQEAVEQFREQHGLFQARGQPISTQQLSDLNLQLVEAQADRTSKEARLRSWTTLTKSGRADSSPEALASPLIQSLREREADLRRREGELKLTYGDRHPLITSVRSEIRDLQTKIQEEIERIGAGLANEVSIARDREATLRASIAQFETRVGQAAMAEVKLRELQREADANQQLFDTFLTRVKETSSSTEISQPDARILSRARPAIQPSYPKTQGMLALAGSGSFLLGLLLGFLRERGESGFQAGEQIEGELNLPVLSVLPQVGKVLFKRRKAHEYVFEKPRSTYTEAIRRLWTSLSLQSHAFTGSLLIASSVPNEGKSTLALSLGAAVARLGLKVIIVEADFRRPSLATTLKLSLGKRDKLLNDVLSGRAMIDEAIIHHPKVDVSLLMARTAELDPLRIVNSPRLKQVLDYLSRSYDLVIVDSPPVLVASDALVLSRLVDATIVLVRWRRTRRRFVINSVNQLLRSSNNIRGTVLTSVSQKQYSYIDTGYYHDHRSLYHKN